MRLRIYLDVLRVPSVTRLLLSAVVGRMPTGMAGLAIVLLVREAGGSYAAAGMVAGAYSAALAVTSPLLGRLVDRVGQTRVLAGCAAASALSFGALATAGRGASPLVLAGLAALAGASIPPVGACMRALWSVVLADDDQLQAAFAVESTVQELIFVVDSVAAFQARHTDGLRFRFGPTEIPGGFWSAFEDPSGNVTYVLDQSTDEAAG